MGTATAQSLQDQRGLAVEEIVEENDRSVHKNTSHTHTAADRATARNRRETAADRATARNEREKDIENDEHGRDENQREWTSKYIRIEEYDEEGDVIPDGQFSSSSGENGDVGNIDDFNETSSVNGGNGDAEKVDDVDDSFPVAKWLGEEKARLFQGIGCIEQITTKLKEYHEEQKKTAQVFPITTDDPNDYDQALLGDTWQDLEIEVTLDSGCVDHVLDASETPGYCIVASPGSKRGQKFVVGNGHKIPNKGQVHLNLEADKGESATSAIGAIFQVAAITRPLMSVGKIFDQDLICTFTKEKATVTNIDGEIICDFIRRGGLYVATMRLKRPSSEPEPSMPFARPER